MSNKQNLQKRKAREAREEQERQNANKVVAGIVIALAVIVSLAIAAYFAVQ